MSRRMRLAELLPDVDGVPPSLEVSGLVLDSRSVRAGDGFVAIGGFGTHGLHFAGRALADGAAAVLFEPPVPGDVPAPPAGAIAVPGLRARMGAMADAFHGRPSAAMSTVAVTGTNGKTSTVQLLAQAWELLGRRAATIGTLGAGLHGDVRPTGFTTPLVLQVHALLAELRDAGAQAVAMETSSHALDQGRVDAVHFEVGVFTNLTRDHLDYHGDMATYGAAKERLFAVPGLAAAVVNVDDGFGQGLFARLPPGLRRIATSARDDARAEVAASDVVLDVAGIAFGLRVGQARHAVRSPLLGRFNVENLLAVAGVLHAQGVAADAIAGVLGRLQPIAGRMNRLGGHDGLPLVVVDYAHTPDALVQALSSVRAHAAGRITCVFGCGGERDRGKRPEMAAAAEQGADAVIVTDDNPRGEEGDAIVAEIMAGFADASRVTVQRDRAAAIARAVGAAGPGDIVLVAGKGHESWQEIGGVRHPFDDRDVAQRALGGRA
ncbi:UDP-N-acetylmuramoyl-L-alanyl-D-glutamate--2,6-diaminopimelate ligase [Luteimonas sp. MC1750]|uniref:UDP-N-acetylmuramoyl-L-alanyl-D-glutamate--2, 6-diaminopimelate ligase n=1 Tax=Luteimonas sp. MC1750 TaxID=2799326 RepID=UPI0018F078D0|nr:UDP-N-acetylmuramoyl-L-alanyl-D-glutamate--2,6-diaminopimelate ligase [Luteimonas sp. MC1750]MBJ6985273.1 UDP-N-acetylmuramoyl-L-alanyl-D-glutamate--2,6-diaminopimelate ligase [Luteimonas sp. MC1750]QQO05462.1 UDP-N-acetylmuramoyl-L-alanyl-D-glutamate--2,6-diaminopimelate ligase [Luteimonas sp. MC1750]